MMIRAIRVAECGRFREPVSVEGFSGGLDVLVGPNEAGKSTLLRALRLALTERHNSNNKDLRQLVSYGASAPLVEVDFDVGGERWRLRKRFLNQRLAELSTLSGAVKVRGAEAEARLEQLLGESGEARFGMLWLAQGTLLAASPEPDKTGQHLISSLLAREIESAAGGDGVRRLHAEVQARLAEHVTASQERKRGRYLALEQRAKATADTHAAASRKQAEIEALIDRLAGLAATAATLADPIAVESRRQRLAAAEAALTDARTTIAERDATRATLAEARGVHEAASAAAARLRDAIAARDRLTAEASADAAAMARLAAALADAGHSATEAERVAAEARRRIAALAAELGHARAHAIAIERRERLVRAQAAATRASELGAGLDAPRVEAGVVAEAQRLASEIRERAAQLDAQSAVVSIAYEPGQAGRIRTRGAPLADGVRIAVDAPLVLEIPGIGRITVSPGHAADRDALAASLAGDRAHLARLLLGSGAADVADLSAREIAQRAIRALRAEADAELKGLAPEGLQALEAQAAEADAALAAATTDTSPRAVRLIETDIEHHRPQLTEATTRHEAAAAAQAQLARDEAALAATTAERERRLAEVAAALPPVADIAATSARLDAAADTASRAYDEAARAHHAASARAPDAAGMARLDADLAAAQEAFRRAEQQLAALEAERARIAGQLEGGGHDDIAGDVARLAAEAERAAADFADLGEEVAALKLLDTELGAATGALKTRFLAPVAARVAPYLAELFPGAEIALGDGYGATGIARGRPMEDFERLSDGTREQIAVLVRLGLARLLAEQGHAAPLILDDALVYSDDHRITAMHRALRSAAQVHQVIVLTCRELPLDGLDGHRLAITPWADA